MIYCFLGRHIWNTAWRRKVLGIESADETPAVEFAPSSKPCLETRSVHLLNCNANFFTFLLNYWALFPSNTTIYHFNSLTYHCAQLSLLVVQSRYMFRLIDPSSGDTLTIVYYWIMRSIWIHIRISRFSFLITVLCTDCIFYESPESRRSLTKSIMFNAATKMFTGFPVLGLQFLTLKLS
jgi:hypothetical protein